MTCGSRGSERDDDMTGPYAYLATKWIAFDDDTSLKIKVMSCRLCCFRQHLSQNEGSAKVSFFLIKDRL